MIVRYYRRPKPTDPILEMVTCKGCVTPKLCKESGACDVHDPIKELAEEAKKELLVKQPEVKKIRKKK